MLKEIEKTIKPVGGIKPSEIIMDDMSETVKPKILHPTEIKLPIQTKGFRDITKRMYEVHLKKNKDYSPANIIVTGLPGVMVRMWDKIARMFNLMGISFPSMAKEVQKAREDVMNIFNNINSETHTGCSINDAKEMVNEVFDKLETKISMDFSKIKVPDPENEPFIDAFEDLAVYSIIGMLVDQGKWGK